MPEENVFNRITREYYQLTSSEKKLANFVVANGQRSQSMSISQLAEACGVAEATISRFCRRMGYRGYSAFRLATAAATAARSSSNPLSGEIQPDDTVPDLCEKLAGAEIDAIRETQALTRPEDIHTAADILLGAGKVLCMGQGGSMLIAEEAAHLFGTVFSSFFPVQDSHMQVIAAANLLEQDAILFFSYSGATKDLMDVLRIARQRKVRIILVTRYRRAGGLRAPVRLHRGAPSAGLRGRPGRPAVFDRRAVLRNVPPGSGALQAPAGTGGRRPVGKARLTAVGFRDIPQLFSNFFHKMTILKIF